MAREAAAQKPCAYCGTDGDLTNEHIWPDCVLKRGGATAKYLGRNAKFFRGDLKIGDVCRKCNNEQLSALDGYACGLYDKYFYNLEHPGKGLIFEYEYGRLLRWLLKVSYNTARTTASEGKALRPYAAYILSGGNPPPEISVRVDLVKPAWDQKSAKMIPAEGYRAALVLWQEKLLPELTIRLVSVNAFYFYITILSDPTADQAPLKAVFEALPETQLAPEHAEVLIRPSGMNVFAAMRDWVTNPLAQASFRAMKKRAR